MAETNKQTKKKNIYIYIYIYIYLVNYKYAQLQEGYTASNSLQWFLAQTVNLKVI